jgi:hypothetical protein
MQGTEAYSSQPQESPHGSSYADHGLSMLFYEPSTSHQLPNTENDAIVTALQASQYQTLLYSPHSATLPAGSLVNDNYNFVVPGFAPQPQILHNPNFGLPTSDAPFRQYSVPSAAPMTAPKPIAHLVRPVTVVTGPGRRGTSTRAPKRQKRHSDLRSTADEQQQPARAPQRSAAVQTHADLQSYAPRNFNVTPADPSSLAPRLPSVLPTTAAQAVAHLIKPPKGSIPHPSHHELLGTTTMETVRARVVLPGETPIQTLRRLMQTDAEEVEDAFAYVQRNYHFT